MSWKPALLGLLVFAAFAVGEAAEKETMRGVDRGKPKPAMPVLLVGANEIVGSVVEPGWPLIVGASRQPDTATAAVPLPAELQVKVTNERGVAVPLTFSRAPTPANVTNPTSFHWIAADGSTRGLPNGTYRVTLVSGVNPPTGWQIEAGEFRVEAPDPERRGRDGFLVLQRATLLGRGDEALAEVDRQIAARSNDSNLWVAKGDILMNNDKPDEAMTAFDKALSLRNKNEREPIAILVRRQKAFQRSLEKRGVIPAP